MYQIRLTASSELPAAEPLLLSAFLLPPHALSTSTKAIRVASTKEKLLLFLLMLILPFEALLFCLTTLTLPDESRYKKKINLKNRGTN
ncbi:hypothetical protein D3C81_1192550 [compost metagenome]